MFDADEYEVEDILDVRSGCRTRFGCFHIQYLKRWEEHRDPASVDESDLQLQCVVEIFDRVSQIILKCSI